MHGSKAFYPINEDDNMKRIINKITSRKLAVTAIVGAATATGMVDLTWPMVAVACCYIISQAMVDAWGD